MLFINISLCHVVGLPTLAIGTLSTSTLEWILPDPTIFSCLIQDAPALPICRAFVVSATVLPGVNLLEHNVPLKVTLPHQYCYSYLGDRMPVTVISATDLPECSPCVYNTRKSAELRGENTGVGGMDLQDV